MGDALDELENAERETIRLDLEAFASLPRTNRKFNEPSRLMHPSDGNSYRCPWIEDSITIHSDGNVSCGVDDPNANRSFGNVHTQSVASIWANPEYVKLRAKLSAGHRCSECNLYTEASEHFTQPVEYRSTPTTIIFEPTVKCNIRCLNEACFANNNPNIKTRDTDYFDKLVFEKLIDELKLNLRYVYFFNYGDPFAHPHAEDMLLYLGQACPDVNVVTSTNGIPLAKRERAIKVVQSRVVSQIVFTIGGITQKSYSRYHVNGRVDLALKGLRNIIDAKRELGIDKPKVIWRYLLFRWNDSDKEIENAIGLATEYGVDEFILYLTHMPIEGTSFRFAPSTPNFLKYRNYITCAGGYTQVAGIPQPDEDGFFAPEEIEGLGPLRWTGWRSRMRFNGACHWIFLALSTNNPAAQRKSTFAFIVTPWCTYKVPLVWMEWQDFSIRRPSSWPSHPEIQIEIVTFDYWFPAELSPEAPLDALPDPRCLGVLLRSAGTPIGHTDDFYQALCASRFSAPTAEDYERLKDAALSNAESLIDHNTARFSHFDE